MIIKRTSARLARVVAGSAPDGPLPLRMCRACVSLLGVDGSTHTRLRTLRSVSRHARRTASPNGWRIFTR